MTGCDEERERARLNIAARVTRMTQEQREAGKGLQEAYAKRRREYLTELYGKYPYAQTETPEREANPDEPHVAPPERKLLV